MEDELRRTVHVADLDDAPRAIIRRAFRLRAFNELEVLRYHQLSPDNIDQCTVIEGRAHLDRALRAGRGAIVMIAHFGANQMIMPALGHRGYAMNQLSAKPTAWSDIRLDERANRLWEVVQRRRWEHEKGLPAQHIDVFGFLRPAYRCLEDNQVLGLACDGGGGTRWIQMPLGLRTAWVSTQPWQLARTTGATVIPTVVVRDPDATVHRVVMEHPLSVGRSDDRRADICQAAEAYGTWLSKWVEQRPAHYLPYLLLRRRVRGSDTHPFFEDYA